MELPAPLRAAADRILEGVALSDLRRAATLLSTRYRAELRDGRLHMDDELAVKAYLTTRLPATYAAVRMSLEAACIVLPDFAPRSLLDIGSGPGTALWAARDCWDTLSEARLIEASAAAHRVGASLAEHLAGVSASWTASNVRDGLSGIATADLVTMAYVLDELEPAAIPALIDRLWALTGEMLVVVEPGTPAGWRRILAVRDQLISLGANIAAPCPHAAPCPLTAPDWCHFARRVARSRLHRLTKGGEVPWEDEKYIFVAASRTPAARPVSRVLAPPRQGKAWVDLKLCEPNGSCANVQVSKRDGDAYRAAKRLDWGDSLSL